MRRLSAGLLLALLLAACGGNGHNTFTAAEVSKCLREQGGSVADKGRDSSGTMLNVEFPDDSHAFVFVGDTELDAVRLETTLSGGLGFAEFIERRDNVTFQWIEPPSDDAQDRMRGCL